jgi:hypothetical protein
MLLFLSWCTYHVTGESFREAAVRGLQEELGITSAVLPQQPLGPMHRRSLVVPGRYLDNELVESYELRGFQGEVRKGAAADDDGCECCWRRWLVLCSAR